MSRHRRETVRPEAPADLAPVQVDDVKVVWVGTAVWTLAFLALLPFHGRLSDDGRGWWLWTCLAGAGLGLLGVAYCRRRDARSRG